jgi:hypothetical protein
MPFTTTLLQPRVAPCPSLSLRLDQTRHKCALLSPHVPVCRPVSVSGTDYESEGRRFEFLPSAPLKALQNTGEAKSSSFTPGLFDSYVTVTG